MEKEQEFSQQVQQQVSQKEDDRLQNPSIDSEQQEEQESNGEGKWKKVQQPKETIKLFMVDFNQCDSKKCSGRKMERFKLIKAIRDKKPKFKGIVLSALGTQIISKEDLIISKQNGICVIDCSWKRLKQTETLRFKNQRILPYVVAGNPVNYGKPYQLSCVQACATALCVMGYTPQAQYIMSKFGWADGFWSLNPKVIQYSQCQNIKQVHQMSISIQNQGFESNNNDKYRNYDMPSSSSEQDQSEDEDQNPQKEPQQEILEGNTQRQIKQLQKRVDKVQLS